MKTCSDCSCDLPGVHANTKRCAACRKLVKKAEGQAWYRANRDDVLAASQAARDTPEGRADNAARARAWRAANPEKHLENQRKHKRRQYGVVDATGETKSGMCAIAGCEYTGPLHFDHWHDGPLKGHFRGWLCPQCNKALGAFKDSPALLRAAADYIELAAGVGWPE